MELFFLSIIGIYIFFLPGFFLSFLFFSWGGIDMIERIMLSCVLSLMGVTLIVAYTNLAGIPLNAVTVMMQVTVVLFVEALIFFIQRKRLQR